jgi:hypothetical protein
MCISDATTCYHGIPMHQMHTRSDYSNQDQNAFLADLQSGPGSLPLYTEEWVEELLSRVFGILGNLEAPQTRSDHAAVQGNASSAASDSASFLLEGNSMFR